MRLNTHALLLISLLILCLSLRAGAFTPHRSLSRASEKLHKFANRHSAGFARDLRLVFQGFAVDQSKNALDQSHQMYCARPGAVSQPNGTSPASPTTTATTTGTGSVDSGATSTIGGNAQNPQSPRPTSAFRLVEEHSGSNFFDGWSFFTQADPTNGIVQYVDEGSARSSGLIEVNDQGNAIMRMETTPQVQGNRRSVRITTENTFSSGIFVLDAIHMPTGCGTWPAFWTNGPNWPVGGEIDILEGVNDYTNNQATIHTASGCTLPSGATSSNLDIEGNLVGGSNCAALETGNQGCGVRSSRSNSYGAAFNDIGGGVYAMLWDDDEVAVWFFARGSIPSDLIAEAPQPGSWGRPTARWPSSSCNTSRFFYNHSAIFTNTLCGDWAGGVWGASGIPGQETSCAARTGSATCEDFVRNNGAQFNDAYWEVRNVKIYQTSRRT